MIAFIIRLFLLLVIILMVYPVLRRLLAGARMKPRDTPIRYEPMVSCAICGLHLPEANAVERRGRHYCSEDHARQAH